MKFHINELIKAREKEINEVLDRQVIADEIGISLKDLGYMFNNWIVDTKTVEKTCKYFNCDPSSLMSVEDSELTDLEEDIIELTDLEDDEVIEVKNKTYEIQDNLKYFEYETPEIKCKPGKPIRLTEDQKTFQKAYNEAIKGRTYSAPIHKIRSILNWSREHFDKTLDELEKAFAVHLISGKTTDYTAKEIQESYVDDFGALRLTVRWMQS